MQLQGATAIVTGGRGGLGSVLCRAFLEAGATVVSADVMGVAEGTIVEGALQVQADVATAAGAQAMVDAALALSGRVDILINNAAINQRIPFEDLDSLTEDVWNRILNVNLTGPFLCSKAVAPIMKRQGNGRIVNTASIAGLTPSGSSIAYACAKAGLVHLTRCLAVALAPDVLVTAVAPGLLETTRIGQNLGPEYIATAKAGSLLHRSAELADVANQIVTLARSDSTTGIVVPIDSGRSFY